MNDRPARISPIMSRTISVAKSFAILSVMAAHVTRASGNPWILTPWRWYAGFGVPLFFMIGGFLFHREENWNAFWWKRWHRLILPWIVCSALTYLVYVVTKPWNSSLFEWFKWTTGSGTWYYYSTCYLLLLVIFQATGTGRALLLLCMTLQPVMLLIESLYPLEVLYPAMVTGDGWMTAYLNLLNWCGFFALGQYIYIYILQERCKELRMLRRTMLIASICLITTMVISYRQNIYGYFYLLTMVMEVAAGVLLYSLSRWFAEKNTWVSRLMIWTGNVTSFIYLTHMPIVQFICNRLPYTAAFDLIRPVFALTIMILLAAFAKWTCRKMKLEKLLWIIGL